MDILYFFIFCVVPILLLNYLSIKPQQKFIKLYKEKINSDELFYPGEINKIYKNKKMLFVKEMPNMMLLRFKIFFGDFQDKELSKTAHEIRFYFIGMILIGILNFLVIGYLIMNS